MSMQDPLADMLTRIRNAQMVGHDSVNLPVSKLKASVASVLKEEGYIYDFSISEGKKSSLTIKLKYFDGRPVIEKIKRISRPGLRIYAQATEIPSVNSGLGIAIVSTSKGVMSDKKARVANIGGEVLCTVF